MALTHLFNLKTEQALIKKFHGSSFDIISNCMISCGCEHLSGSEIAI